MYIVYDSNQREIYQMDGWTHPPGINSKLDDPKEVPEFKPTWLVRVSDMQVVPGASVNEHYWALSYAWSQSGQITKKGEDFERVDEGKHEIITYKTQKNIEQEDWQGKRRNAYETDLESKTTRNVKFEGLIQKICQDFGIRYIFYDQMCVVQDNHQDKMREIEQMHLFYENAHCTLVLVPELEHKDTVFHRNSPANIDAIADSEWGTRAWTLLEAYSSKNILFVGRNVHFWSNAIRRVFTQSKADVFIRDVCSNVNKWGVSRSVWYARTRTSSRAHDRIFALANMFPDVKHGINFTYDQPLLDLMVRFFGLLVHKDLTMLLFGAPIDPTISDEKATDRPQDANYLPSWTGINGVHMQEDPVFGNTLKPDISDYKITGKYLYLSSAAIPVKIVKPSSIQKAADTEDSYGDYTKDGQPLNFLREDENGPPHISGASFLTFVSTTNEGHSTHTEEYGLKATHFLPVRQEEEEQWTNTLKAPTHIGAFLSLTEECTECHLLSGIPFDLLYDVIAMPVVKKDKENYKLIGSCFLDRSTSFDSATHTRHDFVIE
ncbi:hypothetical protein BJV82DRAFT_673226 [Fennellomyces sp. T-0311]|nr:hypothetical protein BJV82DRAFT_673226 [Fennellomyces sp. T-0311]